MQDFVQRFTELVQRAQNVAAEQEVNAPAALKERIARVEGLRIHLDQRRAEAEVRRLPGLGFEVDRPKRGSPWLQYEITWLASQPTRGLLVELDRSTGRLRWRWRHVATGDHWHEADLSRFNPEHLDNLLYALAEQEAWGRQEPPAVDVPGKESIETRRAEGGPA